MNRGVSLSALIITIIVMIILISSVLIDMNAETYKEERRYCPTCGRRINEILY